MQYILRYGERTFPVTAPAVERDAATTAVAIRPDYAPIVPATNRPLVMPQSDILALVHLSNALARSAGYAVPKEMNDPRKVFIVIYAGAELGIRPMVAINNMFLVNGRLEKNAQLMMGIVMAHDPTAEFRFVQGPALDVGCKVELWRRGSLRAVGMWTPEDATRSGQLESKRRKVEKWKQGRDGRWVPDKFATDANGQPVYEEAPPGRWQLWPTDMYAWAAVKRACRLGAPDLINAIDVGGGVAVETVEEPEPPAQIAPPAEPVAFLDQFEAPNEPLSPSVGSQEPQDADPSEYPPESGSAPQAATGEAEYEFFWMPVLLPLRAKLSITDDEFNAIVGPGPKEEMFQRIDRWLFDQEFTDINVRVRQLIGAVQAKRTPAGNLWDS